MEPKYGIVKIEMDYHLFVYKKTNFSTKVKSNVSFIYTCKWIFESAVELSTRNHLSFLNTCMCTLWRLLRVFQITLSTL